METIRIIKVDDTIPTPRMANPGDCGLDLIAYKIHKEYDNVVMVSTGVKVQPPAGYHFKLYSRSSLHKKGFMLANSVGVIDSGYQGEVLAPLLKLEEHADANMLVSNRERIVQLVLEKNFTDFPISIVENFETSVRGEGGFGSSGS